MSCHAPQSDATVQQLPSPVSCLSGSNCEASRHSEAVSESQGQPGLGVLRSTQSQMRPDTAASISRWLQLTNTHVPLCRSTSPICPPTSPASSLPCSPQPHTFPEGRLGDPPLPTHPTKLPFRSSPHVSGQPTGSLRAATSGWVTGSRLCCWCWPFWASASSCSRCSRTRGLEFRPLLPGTQSGHSSLCYHRWDWTALGTTIVGV